MKYFYIETYGCQMNAAQSGQVKEMLCRSGFIPGEDYRSADIIIINACSVREHAEKKVFDRISFFQSLKKKRKILLMVIGCFAQNNGEKINADLVLGTSRFHTIPELLSRKIREKYLDLDMEEYLFLPPVHEEQYPFRALVDIMKGCNHYCSYCIVPFVRGRQISRKSGDILREVRDLADKGTREIILLGQNINNFGQDNKDIGLAELLFHINAIPGIQRIRFLTSHPKDFTNEIIDAVFRNPKVCPSLHLPVQSGSDRVLGLMNRRYTREQYLGIIRTIQSYGKEYSLSTDFLVGFPGETEQDFMETLSLAREVRFDEAFLFKYSPRPNTRASLLKETLTADEKKERLSHLIKIQKDIEKEKIKDSLNKERTVLAEDVSLKNKDQYSGRDELNHMVVLPGPVQKGGMVRVRIRQIKGMTLIGEKI
ncbi:MAG: tRNA (N6-isopentenyl adenosine(37)-C2)-methylthiotransferase MiaB [bacterium]|nr:tRNA (N6-isopentenyl adenosine(37)-C2)-methylthiotransferase MiaB [bacterium]